MKYFNNDIQQRQHLFSDKGWLGKSWLNNYDTVVKVDHLNNVDDIVNKEKLPSNLSTLFVHGGLHPNFTFEGLNKVGKEWLLKLLKNEKGWSKLETSLWSKDGPYWYRGYALNEDNCTLAKNAMKAMGEYY